LKKQLLLKQLQKTISNEKMLIVTPRKKKITFWRKSN